MNPELQSKLEASADKLIAFLEQSGSASVDFAKEQVPLVVEEILRWGWWSSAFVVSTVVILFVAVLSAAIVVVRKAQWSKSEIDPTQVAGIVLGTSSVVLGMVAVAVVPTNCHTMLKITVAPRIYLIEQLKGLAQ